MAKKRILDTVHETAKGLHETGVMDTKTMREFDALCLPPVKNLSAAQIKRLRTRFESLGIERSQTEEEPLIPAVDAVRFLDMCDSHDVAVLGVEGFRVRDDTMTPDMNLIGDYSSADRTPWEQFRTVCNASARQLVKSVDGQSDDLRFIFVLEEPGLVVVGSDEDPGAAPGRGDAA